MDNQQPVAQKSRSLWLVIALGIVALVAGVWAWMGNNNANTNSTSTANTNVVTQNVNTAAANTNTAAVTTYSYKGQDGKTALELLKAAYPKSTTKTSGSLGEYVTGINGQEAGTSEYWEFLVNGKSSAVGAGSYVTKSTDTLEWKLTSF